MTAPSCGTFLRSTGCSWTTHAAGTASVNTSALFFSLVGDGRAAFSRSIHLLTLWHRIVNLWITRPHCRVDNDNNYESQQSFIFLTPNLRLGCFPTSSSQVKIKVSSRRRRQQAVCQPQICKGYSGRAEQASSLATLFFPSPTQEGDTKKAFPGVLNSHRRLLRRWFGPAGLACI